MKFDEKEIDQMLENNEMDSEKWSRLQFDISCKASTSFLRKWKDKVYWNSVSEYRKLTEEELWEFEKELDYRVLAEMQELPSKFIVKHIDKLNVGNVSSEQYLDEDDFMNVIDKLYLPYVVNNNKYDFIFLSKLYKDYISQDEEANMEFCYRFKFPDSFIIENNELINWNSYCIRNIPSREIMDRFHGKIDWKLVLRNKNVNDFLPHSNKYMKYFTQGAWKELLKLCDIDENVIVDNIDNIDLFAISEYKIFSIEFIKKYGHSLDWYYVLKNTEVPLEIKQEFVDEIISSYTIHVKSLQNSIDDSQYHYEF